MIERRPRVLTDIVEHAEYIGERSLDAGLRFPDAVEATLAFLERHPGVGAPRRMRRRPLGGLRSWPVRGFERHLVFYKRTRGGIVVVRILHAARNIDAALDE